MTREWLTIAAAPATSGRSKRWDMISSKPSVGIVLYHTELDAFIVVRQFRPAVRMVPTPSSMLIPSISMTHLCTSVLLMMVIM